MFARCRGGCCKNHPGLEPLGGMRGSLVLASGNGRSAGEEGEGRGREKRVRLQNIAKTGWLLRSTWLFMASQPVSKEMAARG